jgi:hypothetical protein
MQTAQLRTSTELLLGKRISETLWANGLALIMQYQYIAASYCVWLNRLVIFNPHLLVHNRSVTLSTYHLLITN